MIGRTAGASRAAARTVTSTAIILCGLAVAGGGVTLLSDRAENVFTLAAIVVGATLALATWNEAIGGVRNLIRVDILVLWVLYGLTFFEFLFPQPGVDAVLTPESARSGTYAVLLGFAGLVIGRHLVRTWRAPLKGLLYRDIRPGAIFSLFVLVTILGYLYILISVDYDVVEMLRQMTLPRFAQSWARGKYGDIYSLLYELGMLISLIPPIAGLMYARATDYSAIQKIFVFVVLALTLFYGFASGTRNVIATYVITLFGAYVLAKPGIKLSRVILLGGITAILLLIVTAYMLEFRNVGLTNFSASDRHYDTVFIDNNITNISQLTLLFPDSFEFLGFEIPYNALIRPIPRVLWPDKPEGLSTSIEAALAASPGTTLSCTFIGEAYMAGGFIAVLIFGLAFGAAAAMWNRIGHDINSPFSQLLYASGFLCAAIAMRSMLSMVPLMLPPLALWIYGRVRQRRVPGPQAGALPVQRRRRGNPLG